MKHGRKEPSGRFEASWLRDGSKLAAGKFGLDLRPLFRNRDRAVVMRSLLVSYYLLSFSETPRSDLKSSSKNDCYALSMVCPSNFSL